MPSWNLKEPLSLKPQSYPSLTPNLFKEYINDTIVAVEAANQGVTMGENTVLGFMFADDFVTNIRNTRRTAGTDIEKALLI